MEESRGEIKEFATEYVNIKEIASNIELSHAVHEFLLKKGYFKTLDAFQEEDVSLAVKNEQEARLKPFRGMADQSFGEMLVLETFDKGKREAFFKVWGRLLPSCSLKEDFNFQKIEFYLRVYFAIFPVHPVNTGIKEETALHRELTNFKNFLESRGTENSTIEEFLPFYALPYIRNPHEHPSFAAIFDLRWAQSLRGYLQDFLRQVLPASGEPILCTVWDRYNNRSNALKSAGCRKTESSRGRIEQLKEECEKIHLLNSQLQAEKTEIENSIETLKTSYSASIITLLSKGKTLLDEVTRLRRGMTGLSESDITQIQQDFMKIERLVLKPEEEKEEYEEPYQLASPNFGQPEEVSLGLGDIPSLNYVKIKQFFEKPESELLFYKNRLFIMIRYSSQGLYNNLVGIIVNK